MATYLLVLVISLSGGSHEYVIDEGLSLGDCFEQLEAVKDYNAHCEIEGSI